MPLSSSLKNQPSFVALGRLTQSSFFTRKLPYPPQGHAVFTSVIRARKNSKMFRRALTCLLSFSLLASAVFAEDLAETRKKTEQGEALAQFNLGLMYDNGT